MNRAREARRRSDGPCVLRGGGRVNVPFADVGAETRRLKPAPTTRRCTGPACPGPVASMPASCALNFDHVGIAQRSRLGAVLTSLSESRWPEVERALLIACGFEPRGDRAWWRRRHRTRPPGSSSGNCGHLRPQSNDAPDLIDPTEPITTCHVAGGSDHVPRAGTPVTRLAASAC